MPGDCFSVEDIEMFFKYGIKELRVCSNLGSYSITYEGERISVNEAKKIYLFSRRQGDEQAKMTGVPNDNPQLNAMRIMATLVPGMKFKEE